MTTTLTMSCGCTLKVDEEDRLVDGTYVPCSDCESDAHFDAMLELHQDGVL